MQELEICQGDKDESRRDDLDGRRRCQRGERRDGRFHARAEHSEDVRRVFGLSQEFVDYAVVDRRSVVVVAVESALRNYDRTIELDPVLIAK